MLSRLRSLLNTRYYDFRCRGILQTAPIKTTDAPLRFVTQLQHKDLVMYLAACKSIYRFVNAGRFVIINDGSLTPADLDILAEHVDRPEVLNIQNISTGPLPRGGTWERLSHIVDLASDHYVIQLDADTLTLAPIPEVVTAYQENVPFTLGTGMGQSIVSFSEAAALVSDFDSNHVQVVAEKQFRDLPSDKYGRYVRGCSAFAGFPKGLRARDGLEWLSAEMESRIGKKWQEWGSEQFASNFTVANAPDAIVLPRPKYATFDISVSLENSAFLHFIGSSRFKRGRYVRDSRRVIKQLDTV